jgi:hypothetical protein
MSDKIDKLHDTLARRDLSSTAKTYKAENGRIQNLATKKLTHAEILAYRNARKGK